jgi:hypothetical protein
MVVVLEFKTTLAGGIGKGFDLAMVFKATTVENNLGDFVCSGTFSDKFSNFASSSHIGSSTGFGAELSFRGIDGNERLADRVVNDLGRDVLSRKMDSQTRAGWCAGELFTQADVTEFTFICGRHGLLDGFAFLAADLFTNEADTFAFVRLWRIISTDICGTLAHNLLVDAFNGELRILSYGNFNTLRDIKQNGVRLAKAEIELLTLDGSFETDAMNFHVTLEAIGDSSDHV